MHVLLTEDYPPKSGGMATWTHEMAHAFERMGCPVVVYARRKRGAYKANSISVHRMGGRNWPLFREVYVFRYVLQIARTYPLCILYACNALLGFVPVLLSRWLSFRVIVVAHGLDVARPLGRIGRWKMRYALKHAHQIAAVSACTRDAVILRGGAPSKVAVVPNGVDVQKFVPQSRSPRLLTQYSLEGRKIILTVARLVERKGHDLVIRALPAVLRRFPECVYLVVGEGRSRKDLEVQVQALGLQQHVVFAGYVPDEELVDYYNLADLYIMLPQELEGGDFEGFGITYLEASACAKPVIATDSGGVTDAVVDGQTGLMVHAEDASAVAKAIIRLLSDSGYAQELGRNGRARVVQKLQWEHSAQKLLALAEVP